MHRISSAFKQSARAAEAGGEAGGESRRGILEGLLEDVSTLARLVGDRSFSVPGTAKLKLILCLVYMVSPIDLIPDFFLPFGLVDDAVVFGLLLKTLGDIAGQYRSFLKGKPARGAGSSSAVEVEAQRVTPAS
jgi:uncharacterized membrane protein YkvA (DUF1232 family)